MNILNTIPEFGIKRENEERRDGGCAVVFDPLNQKYAVGREHETGRLRLFSGGVDSSEDIQAGIFREVLEESGLYDFQYSEKIAEAMSHFYNRLKNVNRVAHATCFLIVLKSTNLKPTKHEEHEKFSLVWATAEEIINDWKSRNQNLDNDHWLYFMEKAIIRVKDLNYLK
ncbi:MAG: NUDIX domain-containing protein [Patescibacteria group bacterium]